MADARGGGRRAACSRSAAGRASSPSGWQRELSAPRSRRGRPVSPRMVELARGSGASTRAWATHRSCRSPTGRSTRVVAALDALPRARCRTRRSPRWPASCTPGGALVAVTNCDRPPRGAARPVGRDRWIRSSSFVARRARSTCGRHFAKSSDRRRCRGTGRTTATYSSRTGDSIAVADRASLTG